jgi:hypothetical protein
VKGTAALGLGEGDGVARALGDGGARARGRRGSSSVKGTAALGLGEGDDVARALGDGGARVRARGRGHGGSLAAQLCQLGWEELGFLPTNEPLIL